MSKILAKRALTPHPDTPFGGAALPIQLGAKLTGLGRDVLRLEFVMVGQLDRIAIPDPEIGQRTDELWRHTCFEAFFQLREGGYAEHNYAPSGNWATYVFDGYRAGMQPSISMPYLHVERQQERLSLVAYVDLAELPSRPDLIGLSAVIEEADGTKSYWALAHPPGKPDFHHPDCFVLQLPATD